MAILRVLALALVGTSWVNAEASCKCGPRDECWPSLARWDDLNESLAGRVLPNVLGIEVCFSENEEDQNTCLELAAFQPTEATLETDENMLSKCPLRPASAYIIRATEADDVAKALVFAKSHNLRVSTGSDRDDLQRSRAKGTLHISTASIRKGTEYHESYPTDSLCPHTKWSGSAFTVQGGYTWAELYTKAFAQNLIVIGNTDQTAEITTSSDTLHPPLHTLGLPADQILSMDVVLASGATVSANACHNPDLFFALRGGSSTAYGVIVSTTLKAHPSRPVTAHSLQVYPAPHRRDPIAGALALIDAVAEILAAYPALSEGEFSGQGSWGVEKVGEGIHLPGVPAAVLANGGYSHVVARVENDGSNGGDGSSRALLDTALMDALRWRNGSSLVVEETVTEYASFGEYFNAVGGMNAMAYGKAAVTSRLLDRTALSADTEMLKEMLRITATNAPEMPHRATIWTHLSLVGRGEDPGDRHVSVHPAWRRSCAVMAPMATLPGDADKGEFEKAQVDATLRKGDALRELAPMTGASLGWKDARNPWWKTDLFGDGYPRLRAIKERYDPGGMFYCETCVGSEDWEEIEKDEGEEGEAVLCRV
ncbi:FAD-binding domain-containing protein [Aspergillus campestris IBT 28561]|uniref:FAD-binding domain-containing protein n=1 Tax=Aspergillus campestris (strain IBT 28561) TaxID=1392248 RepID=A0A2I1CU05_ASPC2|nr:FAD-binding domain-containing protein [Aspergillus campestris IBT 28561]PKY01113.1 FAD-binding domain-containing protein [Aspergillus campestris IBT 28561]